MPGFNFSNKQPQAPQPPEFFGGLESLRGLAALLVVFYHTGDTFKDSPFVSSRFVGNGYLMVDLFFVLSGFVIFHSYGRKIKSGREMIRFIFVRFGRLYPLHLATLLLFAGVECAKYVGESKYGMVPHATTAFSLNNAPAFIANLFMVHPFFNFSNSTFNSPSWSVGTEFYTYVLFGVLALLAAHRKSPRLPAAAMVATAIALLAFFHSYYLNSVTFICFLRCVMGFFIGVLAYDFFLDAGWIRRRGNVISLVMVVLLAVFLSCKPPNSPGWDYAVLPCYALLIVAVADTTSGIVAKILNSSWPRWLGRISYSIYMCHLFVILILNRLFPPTERLVTEHTKMAIPVRTTDVCLKLSFVFLTVLLVLLLSQLTYSWIEQPFLKKFREWSKSLFPVAAQPAASPS